MRKFHAMLKILVVAKFDELPPFAIGCVWENNRHLRLKEPKFNPERIVSAESPGHPAYQPYAKGRLRYAPAFKGSPMEIKHERDIRDNWWRKSGTPTLMFSVSCRLTLLTIIAPAGARDDAPAPETFQGMQEVQAVGEMETENSTDVSRSVNKHGELIHNVVHRML